MSQPQGAVTSSNTKDVTRKARRTPPSQTSTPAVTTSTGQVVTPKTPAILGKVTTVTTYSLRVVEKVHTGTKKKFVGNGRYGWDGCYAPHPTAKCAACGCPLQPIPSTPPEVRVCRRCTEAFDQENTRRFPPLCTTVLTAKNGEVKSQLTGPEKPANEVVKREPRIPKKGGKHLAENSTETARYSAAIFRTSRKLGK